MASTTTPQASSYSLLLRTRKCSSNRMLELHQAIIAIRTKTRTRNRNRNHGGSYSLRVFATQGPSQPAGAGQKAPPDMDTRIHWDNEDEGWLGGGSGDSSSSQTEQQTFNEEEAKKSLLGEKFADLLNESSDSHYQFLGISTKADLEEIKAAYRKLSKEYHPDTTSLPLKAASEKFLKLREVYDVLSDEERRNFYDWTLAQEAASRKAEKMRMRFEDPQREDLDNYVPVPDLVDRLGGRNLDLNEEAMLALSFDAVVIIFAICCIIYVLFFKEPYYY
uniref:Chaperone DnaJ-domain superfamily protein n=1 Tax=Hypseocharis bilobata TaxID=253189 RepID=A0A0F7H154_9ROSI